MRIKKIKEIEILSSKFTMIWNKTHNGGKFSWSNATIEIGIKDYNKDPLYTLNILNHELMELILVGMGCRYGNGREENYLFNYGHQSFENAIQIFTQAQSKFLY